MVRALSIVMGSLAVASSAFAAILTEEDAVHRAEAAIAQGHWTDLGRECLSFEPVEPAWSFVVREEHNNLCGGDNLTAPRLFTVHVDPQSGVVQRQD